MHFDGREIVIVEPGSLQALVVQAESQRFHQVQRRAGVRAQADHIARIRRNLGLEQHDVEHGRRAAAALWVGRARLRNDHALRGIVEFDLQAAKFFDDAQIDRLLQIEPRN